MKMERGEEEKRRAGSSMKKVKSKLGIKLELCEKGRRKRKEERDKGIGGWWVNSSFPYDLDGIIHDPWNKRMDLPGS